MEIFFTHVSCVCLFSGRRRQDGVLFCAWASKKFGMPVGPITLADEVGIDVTSHVARFLANADLERTVNESLSHRLYREKWPNTKAMGSQRCLALTAFVDGLQTQCRTCRL